MPKRPTNWNKGQGRHNDDSEDERRRDSPRRDERDDTRRRRDDSRRRQSKKSDDKRSHSSSQHSDVEIRIAKLEKELQRQRDLARKESTKGRSPSRGSTKSRAQSHTSKGRTSRPPTPRSSNKRPRSESRSSSKKSKSGREEPTKAKYPKKDNKALNRDSKREVSKVLVKKEVKEFTVRKTYKSPERPAFIPETKTPIRLPTRENDLLVWRPLFQTHGTDRIQVNPVHLSLTAGKEWLADVFNFGFVTLHAFIKDNVLIICSPSGHVIVFTKTGSVLMIPPEIREILFKNPDIRKVTLVKDAINSFCENNGMEKVPLTDFYVIAKKNVPEITYGTFNFFKIQLGKDFLTKGLFTPNEDEHVRNAAHHGRTVSYAVWFVVARLASRAGLTPEGNISSFLRYALFSEDVDMYRNLISDPYYVPVEELSLTPLDQRTLDQESARLNQVMTHSYKNYRFKADKPFDPIAPETQCCRTCGLYSRPDKRKSHKCNVKPTCGYPLCKEDKPHTVLTCRYIRAWCALCQHRGHVDTQHPEDKRYPVCYLWAQFLKFSRLNMDTAYVFQKDKYQNPFIHQLGLYGLPPSRLPKVAPETGVGQDLPNDPRFKRPTPPAAQPIRPANTKKPIPTKPKMVKPETSAPKLITLADLNKAVNLTKKISSKEKAGTSGVPPACKNPIVTTLLQLVEDLQTAGIVPAPEVKMEVDPPTKTTSSRKSRREFYEAKKAQDEKKVEKVNESELSKQLFGDVSVVDPLSNRSPVPNEHLLDEPDDFDMNAPKNETPTNNLSEGETDLMEIDLLESVTPLLNEDLAVNVQQVSLISEESGSTTNPTPQ